jgi:hypothetical protein
MLIQRTSRNLRTMPSNPCFFGAFDQKEFIAEQAEKETTIEETISQKVGPGSKFKRSRFEKSATVHEEVESNQAPKNGEHVPEETSKEFRHAIAKFSKEKGGKGSMLDFALNRNSVTESLRNIFNVAFAVRDGSVGLDGIGAVTSNIHNSLKQHEKNVFKG